MRRLSDEQAAAIREMSLRLARWDRNRKAALIEKRRKAGLTQADVARRMGVPRMWVRRFEEYDSDPRMSEIRRYTTAVLAFPNPLADIDPAELPGHDDWKKD